MEFQSEASQLLHLPQTNMEPILDSKSPLVQSSPSVPVTRERFQLERISTITGLHPNYLLYELSINPSFQIPTTQVQEHIRSIELYSNFLERPPRISSQEIGNILRTNPLSSSAVIKEHLLRLMGGRLVGSMFLSSIEKFHEVSYHAPQALIGSRSPKGQLALFGMKINRINLQDVFFQQR
jgi:hypothetical protein